MAFLWSCDPCACLPRRGRAGLVGDRHALQHANRPEVPIANRQLHFRRLRRSWQWLPMCYFMESAIWRHDLPAMHRQKIAYNDVNFRHCAACNFLVIWLFKPHHDWRSVVRCRLYWLPVRHGVKPLSVATQARSVRLEIPTCQDIALRPSAAPF